MTDAPDSLTLYEQLADDLTRQIDTGVYQSGDRLPSVRQSSQQHGISISTVLQAYRLLEDRGVIEARPQSGYYVSGRAVLASLRLEPEVSQPPIDPKNVRIDNLTMQVLHQASRPELVQFGAALPDPEVLPTQRLNRILAQLARDCPYPENLCAIPEGTLELRTQVARRMARMSCAVAPEDVIITIGTTEALSLALRAICQPGDLVAVESPTYFGLLQILEVMGLVALEIPTHQRDGISLEALQFALEHHPVKTVVVMSNFHNPLGSLMPEEKKRALVELLSRYDIPLIDDDIYGELVHGDQRPGLTKTYDKDGRVLHCSSFTKDVAPSYRVGWIVPGRYYDRVQQLKVATNIGTPVILQLAIAEFLENGGFDRNLRAMRRVYAQKTNQLIQAVLRYFPAGTRVTTPQGGYVLWVQLPERIDSLDLYNRAVQHGITLAPGYIFSPTTRYRNFIRLNAAYMNFATEKAVQRLGKMAAEIL